jgi:RND family efflux transporter MFP subunit
LTTSSRRLLTIALVLLACVGLMTWIVRAQTRLAPTDEVPRSSSQAPRTLPPVPVVLAAVTEREDDDEIDVVGSALAQRSVTLFPAVAGEVAELDFRAGQRVAAGQRLLRLDDRRERLAVEMAAARLDAARQLQARYEATRGTGAVPGSIIDEADSGVRLAEIELRQAREALADRSLRAPFAGVVGIAEVEPGDRVGTDTAVTTLDDRRNLHAAIELPEAYAARLKVGQALTVTNPAFGARRFDGRIALLDSRVDAVSRTLRLRAEVPNGHDLLRPGMSFQVRLSLPGQRYATVPELALQWGRQGAFVWTVREGRAAQVPVRSVKRVDALVLVDGDLKAGERVVVEGVQRLSAGRPVRVVGDAAEAASAQASR